MKYIKLFDSYEKDYIKDSINDILVELKDKNMLVEVWHWKPKKKWKMGEDHREYYTISIKGVFDRTIDYLEYGDSDLYRKYNTNLISDYVDTVIDFMQEFCPDFEVYFEYYDNGEVDLGESEKLVKNKEVVQTVFTFTKK